MLRYMIAYGLVACAASNASAQIYSYAFGTKYEVTISRNALEKSPAWEHSADNPPVSPRKAIDLANAIKDSLVKDTTRHEWRLVSASLVPANAPGKWYWLVRYEAHVRVGGSSGIPDHLQLVVLMDGKAIQPKVVPNRRP